MKGTRRDGFSLVELIVSLLVLTVGVLALATALGYLILQVRSADARTERSMVVERVEERLRGTDFNSISTVAKSDAETFGDYDVWWDVASENANLKTVTIFTEGPGFATDQGWVLTLPDSSSLSLARIGP